MSHINQVSVSDQDAYHDIGAFPGDEETTLEFDLRLNRQDKRRTVIDKLKAHLERFLGMVGR